MSFPVVGSTATNEDVISDTDHIVNLPTSIAAGDLLIICHWGSGTDSSPNTAATGWTVLKDQVGTGSGSHMAILYKIASGSEGSSVTLTTDVAEHSANAAYRITAASWHGTTPPEASLTNVQSNNSPNPLTLTASWGAEDNLWIAIAGMDGATADVTGYPTGYTSNQITAATNTVGGGAVAMCSLNLNTATQDPDAFGFDTSTVNNAFTVVVRPAAGGGGGSVTRGYFGLLGVS